MKIKVGDIKIKHLINEDTYQNIFNLLKKDDEVIFNALQNKKKVKYKTKVFNKYGNEVILQYGNDYYKVYPGSFTNDGKLTIHQFNPSSKNVNNTSKTSKTIEGIVKVLVKRNGEVIGSATSDKKNKGGKKQKGLKDLLKKRREELNNEIRDFDEDDVIKVTTGELETSGRNKGGIKSGSETELEFIVKSDDDTSNIELELLDVSGVKSGEYKDLKGKSLFIGLDSIILTVEGLELVVKYKSDDGQVSKKNIKNVISFDNVGMTKPEEDEPITDEEKWEIINSSPTLRKMYLGDSSFLEKLFAKRKGGKSNFFNDLFGRTDMDYSKGNIDRIFNKVDGPLSDLSVNEKVEFTYLGKDFNLGNKYTMKKGSDYVGRFIGDDVIQFKSPKNNRSRQDVVNFKVEKTDEDGIAIVKPKHKYTEGGQPKKVEMKRTKIKILEKE